MIPNEWDLLIIGAGPAGLSAAFTAKQFGLSYVVLERGFIAQTVYDYPLAQPLHSPADDVELLWGELHSLSSTPSREEVLTHYNRFALQEQRLNIRTFEDVQLIRRSPRGFTVKTSRGLYQAQRVIMATGGFGIPRRLDVPGETAQKVSYRFVEGYPFAGCEVLVVGGGNSAAETALALHRAAAHVTFSLRRPSLAPRNAAQDAYTVIKPWNRQDLERLHAEGRLRILYSSQVVGITPDSAILQVEGQAHSMIIPCQHIFAMIGADPDVSLLRGIGAEIANDGRPVYNSKTFETTVPGLFVAGHLSRELHMKNAILGARTIVCHMAGADMASCKEKSAVEKLMKTIQRVRYRSPLARKMIRKYPPLRKAVQSVL